MCMRTHMSNPTATRGGAKAALGQQADELLDAVKTVNVLKRHAPPTLRASLIRYRPPRASHDAACHARPDPPAPTGRLLVHVHVHVVLKVGSSSTKCASCIMSKRLWK